jgi:hypothetical protein
MFQAQPAGGDLPPGARCAFMEVCPPSPARSGRSCSGKTTPTAGAVLHGWRSVTVMTPFKASLYCNGTSHFSLRSSGRPFVRRDLRGRPTRQFLERVSNHHRLVSHCREIVVFRQARNPGKLQNTVHCNHCTVPAGSGSAAQVARRQNPKRGLRRSCPDWDEQ